MEGVRFVSPRQVEQITTLSRRHYKRLEAGGLFPRMVRLGEGPHGRVAYVESEVLAWNAARLAERDAATGPASAENHNGAAMPVLGSKKRRPSSADLDLPIDGLELSTRARNALINDGVGSLGALIQKSEIDLLTTPNIGKVCLREIKSMLARRGLQLAPPEPPPPQPPGSSEQKAAPVS